LPVAPPEDRTTGTVPGLFDLDEDVITLVSRGYAGPRAEDVAKHLAKAGFSFDRENGGVWRHRIAALTLNTISSTEVSSLLTLCRSHHCTPAASDRVALLQRKASPGDRFIFASEEGPDEPLRLAVVFPYDASTLNDFKDSTHGVEREFGATALGRITRKCWFVDLPAGAVESFFGFAYRHDLPLIGNTRDRLLNLADTLRPQIHLSDDKIVVPTPGYNAALTAFLKGLGVGARFWSKCPSTDGPGWVLPQSAATCLAPLLTSSDLHTRYRATVDVRLLMEASPSVVSSPLPTASQNTNHPKSI
jgi:hypothetical protein